MGTRILTFGPSIEVIDGKTRLGATFYIEADYTPVATRIYAGRPTTTADAKIDILDENNVSIFENRAITWSNITTGVRTVPDAETNAILVEGENGEEYAEDFSTDVDGETIIIQKGSWLHCIIEHTGGGDNFSVSLELNTSTEALTEEE